MTPYEVDTILNKIEVEIGFGGTPDLRGTHFWSAVAATKRDPDLVSKFADRIGAIDRAAHDAWARLVIPLTVGTILATVAALIGIGIVTGSLIVDFQWRGVAFLAGAGVLVGSTHGLGHLVVGYMVGIRFSGWFIGRARPQPGVKINYATYLRASPRSRAWMHASGAIVTKFIPFLLVPVALALSAIPMWATLALLVLGVIQIVADVLWSTKSSDWAKYLREIDFV